MIKSGKTKAHMDFDRGVFTGVISVSNPKLEYPNKYEYGISEDVIVAIEASISTIVDSILEEIPEVDEDEKNN